MAVNEQEFNIKLVESIEKYPCLYNYKLREYSRKDLTEKAWAEISQEVNEKVTTCKEKWKNIRTVFVRKIKSGPKSKKPYYLNDLMQFVLPFVKPYTVNDETQGNLHSPSPDIVKNESEYEQDNDYLDNQSEILPKHRKEFEPVIGKHHNIVNKSKKRKSELHEGDRSFIELCNHRNIKTDYGDDYKKMFLLSLLPELRQMNEKQMKQFRRKVLKLIDNISNDRPVSPSSSISSWTYIREPMPSTTMSSSSSICHQ